MANLSEQEATRTRVFVSTDDLITDSIMPDKAVSDMAPPAVALLRCLFVPSSEEKKKQFSPSSAVEPLGLLMKIKHGLFRWARPRPRLRHI